VHAQVLRTVDSLQLTATRQLTTPAQWQPGDDVIIAGSVSDDQAKERYPDGWQQPLPTCASSRRRRSGHTYRSNILQRALHFGKCGRV
jgi:C-terminal domain of 1-Cys peroxiredoxin